MVEVLAALSLTTDLASGVPFEKGLPTSAVATAFARSLGLDDAVHLWTFGPDGEVTASRHYVDTAKHLAAACGEDAAV